jgi:hypothetical protein
MAERIEMTAKFQVTEAQALALEAMFKYWTLLGRRGSSRWVSFYVDGDGDFKPECQVSYSRPITPLTPQLEKAAVVNPSTTDGNLKFDFDGIAWELNAIKKQSTNS